MTQRRNKTIGQTLAIAFFVLSARTALGQERGLLPTAPSSPPVADAAPSLTPPMAPPTPKPDGRIAVQLRDGSRLVGKLVGLDTLKFKASFGEIAVPVESVLGVRFPTVGNPAIGATTGATVLFTNGDVLTVEPLVASLKLETAWGETLIAGKHLESLVMTTERVQWAFDGKWRLLPEGTAHPAYSPYPNASAYAPVWSAVPPGLPSYPIPMPGPSYAPPAFSAPSTLPTPARPAPPLPAPSLTPQSS